METVKRIEKLTPGQEAQMRPWAEKWIKIGLSTAETTDEDREKFKTAVGRCYEAAGLEAPKRIVWVKSPIVLALAAPVASMLIALNGKLAPAKGRKKLDLRGAVDGAVRGAVDGAVHGAVGGAVGDAVHGERDTIRQQIRQAVAESIRRAWPYIFGGQFWVGSWGWWGSPSFVSFFREVCGLTLSEEMNARAQAYAETAMRACWWWPHKDFVMVCERPSVIARDERGRLHSLTGPACGFGDGWGVYAVHGVRVPANVIEHPELLTVARIDGEQNAEVRRVMIERYGIGTYLADAGAQKLDEDKDSLGLPRRLWRKPLSGDEDIVVVEVQNSTPETDGTRRTYFLRVQPELRPLLDNDRLGEPQKATCHNAVASTFGMRGEEYRPEVET